MEAVKTNFVLVTSEPDLMKIRQFLGDDANGAQVIFVGTVRHQTNGKNVEALDFEAYEPMAISELNKIAREIDEKWPVTHVALHHAIGKKAVGEIAVIAGIGSPHRKEGFEACAYLMDRLKLSVPIWKKEIFEDGEEWVTPTP